MTFKNWKTWPFQGSSRSCHLSACGSLRVVGSNTAGKNPRAGMWSKRQYSCTKLLGKNWIMLMYLYYAVFFYPKVVGSKITISKYLILVHGLQQTLIKYICTASNLQIRRATTFQSCLPGDTCSTCMSIPRPFLRGVLFIFAEYILSHVVRTHMIFTTRPTLA